MFDRDALARAIHRAEFGKDVSPAEIQHYWDNWPEHRDRAYRAADAAIAFHEQTDARP